MPQSKIRVEEGKKGNQWDVVITTEHKFPFLDQETAERIAKTYSIEDILNTFLEPKEKP